VEWVETTGRTLEDAKDAALDQLGVDEDDAEFEVLEEPKSGLFGLTRKEARVRARVRPTTPRPKVDRRDRRRRGSSRNGRSRSTGRSNEGAKSSARTTDADSSGESATTTEVARADGPPKRRSRSRSRSRGASGSEGSGARTDTADRAADDSDTDSPISSDGTAPSRTKDTQMPSADDVTVDEQATIISEFLEGLLEAYGLDGELGSTKVDDETIEIEVTGGDLGLLIGPKGQTLAAIQDLSRTVVQRQASGTHHGRVRLDVGGYRQRRREALERFAASVAAEVKESGSQRALEPMNAADRKVVHDTVNGIDGVATVSEGEDLRRRVVVIPAP
jgi:spoIIIJ-associated protein